MILTSVIISLLLDTSVFCALNENTNLHKNLYSRSFSCKTRCYDGFHLTAETAGNVTSSWVSHVKEHTNFNFSPSNR